MVHKFKVTQSPGRAMLGYNKIRDFPRENESIRHRPYDQQIEVTVGWSCVLQDHWALEQTYRGAETKMRINESQWSSVNDVNDRAKWNKSLRIKDFDF